MARKGKSEAAKAAAINGARTHGRKMGLAKREELKKDASARQELAADYYRRSEDVEEYDPAERAYYQAFADALMGVQTTDMVVTPASSKKKKRSYDPFEKVKEWRRFFGRVFTAPFAFSFAGGGGGQSGDEVSASSPHSPASNKTPKLPPVAAYVVTFIIGAIVGIVATGDFGVALVLGSAATREVYARKADNYNPWVARAIGIIPPSLTLLGTMWQFGAALALHLWVWKHIPYLYQEPDPGEDNQHDDMPSSI